MTNEEATRILKVMRKDADIHANTIPGINGFIKKRDALDMAIYAIQGYEILGDAVEQALDKYLAPNLATEIKNEITQILAGTVGKDDGP